MLWNRLWKYFGVDDYKYKCFPQGKKKELTDDEEKFLRAYFENPSCTDNRVQVFDEYKTQQRSTKDKTHISKSVCNFEKFWLVQKSYFC